MKKILFALFFTVLMPGVPAFPGSEPDTRSVTAAITLIPYPKSVQAGSSFFILHPGVSICINKNASSEDLFAADDLRHQLAEEWGIGVKMQTKWEGTGIRLRLAGGLKSLGEEGYRLEITDSSAIISAPHSAGLFYGIQTLLQLIHKVNGQICIRTMMINDSPDLQFRAVHYDTKHFQEKKEYVLGFIRTLARYKINVLIWEWEDKFAYRSHPEIAAPGAFTMEEMQEFTRYAQKYHIQIVPLVQGLGHVSYILKHPEFSDLREIESDNWGFCPLKEGTYKLMTDLVREAAEATPGSKYIHIGCDETYVLGKGLACGCSGKAGKDGKYSLLMTYINRMAGEVKKLNRIPISWDGGFNPAEKIRPVTGLLTPGGFNRELDSASLAAGYPLYIYDPNPGIEHLFLPYFYREDIDGPTTSHLQNSYSVLTEQVRSGKFKGVISTSWNCSGVHNQIWMLRYITAAEYSWNARGPSLDEFVDSYFSIYYGPRGKDIKELFILLNKASYFYMSAFERKVWHWGEIGKTHLPDLPRDDMEFDPFWNTQYSEMVKKSKDLIPVMDRALSICNENLGSAVKNSYDFELFRCIAGLFRHTAETYLTLSELERSVQRAADSHFSDPSVTCSELEKAADHLAANIAERDSIFGEIKKTWEKSQLPKGMSTPEKKYLHARDQQRNFANRRPDLTFMICNERDLGIDEYLLKLRDYAANYKTRYLSK